MTVNDIRNGSFSDSNKIIDFVELSEDQEIYLFLTFFCEYLFRY